ncbi:protoporphyrinogen oxidase [Naumannella halotolerans]|uniref:protoporphyrinogen oxidase n=1 Tax=Naumannella halotolerans TaxID=993414 RepID=UPI00370DBFC4
MSSHSTDPDFAPTSAAARRVVVIGGGLTGLTTAWALRDADLQVTVLESSDRIGGQLHSLAPAELNGALIDVGAESVHLGAPHLAKLVTELGLRDEVVTAEPGSSRLLTRRGLRPLPAGVGPTGPTRLGPVLRSGIVPVPGLLRAGLEPLFARPVTEDISVGDFVRRRFGSAITEIFVDPLLGNLHAGDVDRLSLAAVAPTLAPMATTGRSMLLRRRPPASGAPMFASWPQGLARLVDGLAAQAGAEVRTGTPATGLRREGSGWVVQTAEEELVADQVVLAVPQSALKGLIGTHFPAAAELLAQTRTADVATIALAYPSAAAEQLEGNGVLLRTDSGRVLKAATWLSRKWARLAGPDQFLVRASAGRVGSSVLDELDDAALAARIHRDLQETTGLRVTPRASVVTRWPEAFPQLEVGHRARIAQVREQLRGSGLLLAGAPVDGLGISATVRSALSAADEVLTGAR